MTNGKIIIKTKRDADSFYGVDLYPQKNRWGRMGKCKACGAKLTSPVSIERGYGERCYKAVPCIIILDIVAGDNV